MYKNFNGSVDYSKNIFESFTKKKPVSTKFNKDQKSYNQNKNKMNKINKKNVNLKKIKPDTDTSMPKPSNFTPKKIKTYATLFGFLLGGLTIWKFVNWMIENQILIPVVISIGLICFILYTKHKKKVY